MTNFERSLSNALDHHSSLVKECNAKEKKIHFQFDHELNTHKVCFIALTWLTKSAITDKIRE